MPNKTKNQIKQYLVDNFLDGGNLPIAELKKILLDIIDSSAFAVDVSQQHTHGNMVVLDNLSEQSGELMYDGAKIAKATTWDSLLGKPIGIAGGIATLDADGKLLPSQLPDIAGALEYQGAYDALINFPNLSSATTTNNGFYYKVSVAGTQDLGSGMVDMGVGDIVVSNGAFWEVIAQGGSGSGGGPVDWGDVSGKPDVATLGSDGKVLPSQLPSLGGGTNALSPIVVIGNSAFVDDSNMNMTVEDGGRYYIKKDLSDQFTTNELFIVLTNDSMAMDNWTFSIYIYLGSTNTEVSIWDTNWDCSFYSLGANRKEGFYKMSVEVMMLDGARLFAGTTTEAWG